MEKILRGLNSAQKKAVTAKAHPTMVAAGPGSGKTHVLMLRIIFQVLNGIVSESQILCLTFTKKAAQEMRNRIQELKMIDYKKVCISTFHSFCFKALKLFGSEIGLKDKFKIIKDSEQEKLIGQIIKKMGLDKKEFKPSDVKNWISYQKNCGKYPQEAFEEAGDSEKEQNFCEIYSEYQQELESKGDLDFEDLLLLTKKVLEECPDVLDYFRDRFRYISVDECQDCNLLQYEIVLLLGKIHQNIFLVGDMDQSIYAFRGAVPDLMINFQSDWSNAQIIKLEENYRSLPEIVELANNLIKHNNRALKKEIYTKNPGDKECIKIIEAASPKKEAEEIAERIKRLVSTDESLNYGDIAILYRANYQSHNFENALNNHGIPYSVVGGVNFFKRKEIKDMLAYLSLIYDDNDIDIKRIINKPARGLGEKSLQAIEDYAKEKKISLFEAVQESVNIKVSRRAQKAMDAFVNLISKLRESANSIDNLGKLIEIIYQKTGYRDSLRKKETPENLEQIANIEELISEGFAFSAEYSNDISLETIIDEFLEMTLFSEEEITEDNRTVKLMTIHKAKGLEFDTVFLPELMENVFPSYNSVKSNEIEEERRLFYVGITRARKKLWLSFSKVRYGFNGKLYDCLPSRFLREALVKDKSDYLD